MSKICQKILLLCEISQKSADLFSVILRQFLAPGNLSPVLPIGPAPGCCAALKNSARFCGAGAVGIRIW